MVADGHVEEGVAELLEAFRILPHPNVLYNIGRAYAESGRYEQAVDYFIRYLESDPPDRAEVAGFLAALQARIASIQARESESEAEAEPEEVVAPTPDVTAVASDEEIAALDDSATQIEALAVSTQSDALHARADRLRALATALRERSAAASTGAATSPNETETTETTETVAETTETEETTEEAPSLVLGEEREGDTYEETVVSSSRAAQSPLDAPNATTIVTAQDIRLSGLHTFGEALRRVPGVDLMTTSPNNVQLSVRGLNQRISNRAIVLVDGRSVYLDFLGGTMFSLIPVAAEDIERIEVIRGPASALYGADAFTGVVNIITRPLGEGRSSINAGVGSHGQYRVAGTITERVERLRFRLSGGYESADTYSRTVGPDRVDVTPFADRPNYGYNRLFFSGEAQLRLADGYNIRAGTGVVSGATTIQAISRLREVQVTDALFTQTYVQANTAFGLSARAFWNRMSADHGATPQHEGGLTTAEQNRVRRQDVMDVELVYTNSFDIVEGIHNQFIAGVGYRFKEIDWGWLAHPISGDTVHTQHHGNLFVQDTLRIEDAVQIVVSLRGDQHPLFDEPQISPRGSVVIHPTPRQSIRISAGTAFRSPTFTESYVNVPNTTPLRAVTAYGRGNPNMNPERIVSVELGYMLQESEYFSVEAAGYYNLVFDQILLSSNTANRLTDFVTNPELAYDPSLAAYPLGQLQFANEEADFQQIGGELSVRLYPVDGLDIYANYAIHETSPLGDTQDLAGRELDARTSAHKFNLGVQYRAPFGLDVSADFHYVSSQRWVEQVLDTERGGVTFQDFGLPEYMVLNARIGWRFFDDQLELSVVGTNLLMDGHREHPFGQQIPRRFMGNVSYRF